MALVRILSKKKVILGKNRRFRLGYKNECKKKVKAGFQWFLKKTVKIIQKTFQCQYIWFF